MVILYRGQIQEIHRELEQYGNILSKRYHELLGSDADTVAEAADRLLPPESFFESPESLGKYSIHVPVHTPNKFLLMYPHNLSASKNGRIQSDAITTSSGFYIREENFPHSGASSYTSRQIASYIHEFDHFVWYVLQKVPLYLATHLLEDLSGVHYPLENAEEWEKLRVREPEDRARRIICGIQAANMRDSFEKATDLLDHLVLKEIGIDHPLSWRGTPKQYTPLPIPGVSVVAFVPAGGDPFLNLSDADALRYNINWERHLSLITPLPYIYTLMDSVKNLHVERLPFPAFVRREEQHDSSRQAAAVRKRLHRRR